jgi:hypothetical protein
MRAMLDDQHAFMLLIEVIVEIENATGLNLSDNEIEGVKSLRDLTRALALIMAALQDQCDAQSIVSAAAYTVGTIEDIDFDVDILTALAPDRWNRA